MAMKMQSRIILRLILFIVVIFSIGPDSHSKAIKTGSIEINADTYTDKSENSFSSYFDSTDEDQIEHLYNPVLTGKHSFQKMIPCDFRGVYTFSISVWQPPKLSCDSFQYLGYIIN
jgi:hypothetical protein